MAPYVALLMPELQAAVVDPLPEVRATAARALGSLLRGMGADHFTELVPWLLATLRSEVCCPPGAMPLLQCECAQGVLAFPLASSWYRIAGKAITAILYVDARIASRGRGTTCDACAAAGGCSSSAAAVWALLARSQLRGRGAGAQGSGVERSGAAQGLAEVLAVLGPDHLAALLPDILQSCRAQRHFEREGALTLFKFLPLAVPDEVQVGALRCFAAPLSNPRGGTARLDAASMPICRSRSCWQRCQLNCQRKQTWSEATASDTTAVALVQTAPERIIQSSTPRPRQVTTHGASPRHTLLSHNSIHPMVCSLDTKVLRRHLTSRRFLYRVVAGPAKH